MLLPMVEEPAEIEAVAAILDELDGEAGRTPIALGAMIETRRAVERVAELATHLRFLSVGTNDLLADFTGRCREELSPGDALSPDFLTLLRTLRRRAGPGVPVSLCGQVAAEAAYLPLWLGLGFREFSVHCQAIGHLRTVIEDLEIAECERLATAALSCVTPEQVAELLGDLR